MEMDRTLTKAFLKMNNLDDYAQFKLFADYVVETNRVDTQISPETEDEQLRNLDCLSKFLDIFSLLNSTLPLKSILEYVIDAAISVIQAERGLLLLCNAKSYMEFELARDCSGNNLTNEEFNLCQNYVKQAIMKKETVFVYDKFLEKTDQSNQGVEQLDSRSVMCYPMYAEGELLGVIYAASSKPITGYAQTKKQLFQLFVNLAAIVIRNAQLRDKVKKSSDKLEKTQQSLLYSDKMAARGRMAAQIGHELNNLLTSLHGNLYLSIHCLKNQDDIEMALNHLSLIKDSIQGMERFSNGLMENSQIETTFERCNLNKLIHDFIEFSKPAFRLTGATFMEDFDSNLPEIEIDKGQIQQVLYNLITNAIEAYDQTKVTIKTRNKHEEGRVKIYIADSGPGIQKEMLEQIFDHGFTDKRAGHGFGLSICQEIIQQHGGSISVESEMGQGTEFTISLPKAFVGNTQNQNMNNMNTVLGSM